MRWRLAVASLALVGCRQIFGLEPPVADDAGSMCAAVRSMSVGWNHSCAVDHAGSVWCWGANEHGQVNATLTASVFVDPIVVELPGPALEVATGKWSTCALLEDHAVYCWGNNEYGQLGDGSGMGGQPRKVALAGAGAIDLSAGAWAACVRTVEDSSIWCWGDGTLGEAGSSIVETTPKLIVGTAGAKQLEVGHRHVCAVDAFDRAICWGRGGQGQLGVDVTTSVNPTPLTVGNLPAVEQVTVASKTSCARDAGGVVRCWGAGSVGELGDGAYRASSSNPITAVVDQVTDVALGNYGACAVRENGTVQCWGDLSAGDGTLIRSATPRTALLANASAISAAFFHVCAIVDGRPQCWGEDAYGQLGRGTRDISPVPVPVTLEGKFIDLAVGGDHACAITDTGLWCWGNNDSGKLGDGTTTGQLVPKQIMTTPLVGVALSDFSSCAWDPANLYCWGSNNFGKLGSGTTMGYVLTPRKATTVNGPFSDVALGSTHACAISGPNGGNSLLQCWGRNASGQLGNGSTTDSTSAVTVGLTNQVAIVATNHTCSLSDTGIISCWGPNGSGQVGDGTRNNRSTPISIILGSPAKQIAAGSRHTCAVTTSGSLYCWGSNDMGQLGMGDIADRTMPTKLLDGVASVSAGNTTTCATLTTGEVRCWGQGDVGQLADGSATSSTAPRTAPALMGAGTMSVSWAGGCADVGNAGVQCWGIGYLLANNEIARTRPMEPKLPCR
jgi:alpha-tubulin suppressor-like RCC1 family protein